MSRLKEINFAGLHRRTLQFIYTRYVNLLDPMRVFLTHYLRILSTPTISYIASITDELTNGWMHEREKEYRALVEMIVTEDSRSTRKKKNPISVTLCPLRNPDGLAWL